MCFTLPPFLLIVSFIYPSGNILRRFDLYGRTDFLAADSMGNLYVSAAGGQHVIKYNYNGEIHIPKLMHMPGMEYRKDG